MNVVKLYWQIQVVKSPGVYQIGYYPCDIKKTNIRRYFGKKTIYYIAIFVVMILINNIVYGDCYRSEMGKTNFPDSIQPELIYSVTGISPQVCGIAVKKWPYKDGLFVVYSESNSGYHIHVLKQIGKTFEVVSHYSSEFGEYDYKFSNFDFAPYKIKGNHTAIGIRFIVKGPTMGGGWECEKLVLYEFSNKEIRPVLSTIVSYLAEGNNVAYDFNTAFYCEEKGIIIIGKPDNSNYNQIIEKVGKKKYFFKYIAGEDSSGGYVCDSIPTCLGDSVSNCFCPSE